MRNRESNTTCFHFSFPYSLSPVVVPGYWLILRSRLAFSFPVFHSVSHLVLVMVCIDLFCADFILIFGGMVLEVAMIHLFISLDILMSWYPFDMNIAGWLGFMNFVDSVED